MLYEQILNKITPYKNDVILCLETAADFLHLSNGVHEEDLFRVYSSRPLNDDTIEVIMQPDCFKTKRYEEWHGIFCTTPEQTILDLLEHEQDVDLQTLLESLSNYYYEHNETFSSLEGQMDTIQKQAFEKWRQDAIDYYTEDF